MGVLDVLKHTQQLFNSRKRQGRGTHIVGIKLQVGGLHWNIGEPGPPPALTSDLRAILLRELRVSRVGAVLAGPGANLARAAPYISALLGPPAWSGGDFTVWLVG